MNAYVAVTDRDWFDFLAAQPDVDEVNFWQPNPWGGEFRVLRRGEPLLFKLKHPVNAIAGSAFFEHYSTAAVPAAMPGGYSDPILTRHRIGQGTFRVAVTEAYRRQCAVTREKALPALEAAHIRPFAEVPEHYVRSGLLLRSDVHRLYDAGYLTVTPDLRVEASTRMREDFHDGESYIRSTSSARSQRRATGSDITRPRNLAALVSTEASELLALFRWDQDALRERPDAVRAELADVLLGVLRFADVAGLDLEAACREKLRLNGLKYPARSNAGPDI